MEKEKRRNRITTAILMVIIMILLLLLLRGCHQQAIDSDPMLGKPGTEYFNQDTPNKEVLKTGGTIGVSIPASITVKDEKALLSIKNTGEESIIPHTLVNGEEVYRASRILDPGDKVSAVIPTGDKADKCITYVETLGGEKFSVTTNLVR